MLLIAHRGGTDRYPELTLQAAKFSLALGADYVELDIRYTQDRVPVIAHDSDALRMFGVPDSIGDLTAEQYRSLRFTGHSLFHPHTLEEVLASGVAPILFHVKGGGKDLLPILEMIRAYAYEDKVVLGVVNVSDVQFVKSLVPEIRVLAFSPLPGQVEAFIEAGADIIRLWEAWVSEESVARIRQAGKQVWIMAGNNAGRMTGYTSIDNIALWRKMNVDGVLLDKVEENLPYVKSSS
ncbi:glycerophosphodiester phosphodiesterase [Cohnella sp. JJ-181]|uniref:glycerophosphodiester phosphodiesterase n=1 Tax=Cohnella rhizoplanae TaxID=2974897 RepID=UPI0022FFA556|nr:glycerophosphodiester phosphodiesterase family protein [Cohnella sp. JJ-181]CAI6085718.1 hypothetical protein COHCIP112018_04766 [Cohnella sp. JJ-181]